MSDEYRLEARLEAIESRISDIQDDNRSYHISLTKLIRYFYVMFVAAFIFMLFYH